MILALSIALAIQPKFTAHFVPVKLENEVLIADARKDFSAVGYSISHGVDWAIVSPIIVLNGHSKLVAPTPDWPSYLPVNLRGSDGYVVQKRSDSSYHLGTLLKSKLSGGKSIVKPQKPKIASVIERVAMPFPKNLWKKRYGQEASFELPDDFIVQWYKTPKGIFGEASMTPTPINQDWWALAKVNGNTVQLQELTNLARGDKVYGLVFVSPEGWLVAAGSRGDQDGLFWIFP